MIRAFALAVALASAARAGAMPLCESSSARKEFYIESRAWQQAFARKDFGPANSAVNAMVARHQLHVASDAFADRALAEFLAGPASYEPLLRDWVEASPYSPAAHYARAYFHAGRGLELRGDRMTAVPEGASRAAMLGEFGIARGELDLAERFLPRHSLGQSLRIRMAAAEGDRAGAADLYRRALAGEPGSLAVRIHYAAASHGRGADVRPLERMLDEMSGLDADDQRYVRYLVWQEMGLVAESRGDFAAAIGWYERSYPLCPGLDTSIARLARLHRHLRDPVALARVATVIVDRDPREGWGYELRGEARKELGQYREAAVDYQAAADLGRPAALARLAWFYETGNGVAKDERKARDLRAMAPENP